MEPITPCLWFEGAARSRVAQAVYATHGELDAVALEKAYRG